MSTSRTVETDELQAEEPQPWRPPEPRPGRAFWMLMGFSLVAVGGLAFLQYIRVDGARTRHSFGRSSTVMDSDLPILGHVPDFALIERAGKNVTLDDLKGKVWIADFIFTYCGGPCPIMTRRMRDLHESLQAEGLKGVTTVSITVDPERDTPKVLTEYASMHDADRYDWLFLTGDRKAIFDLSIRGFKLTAEPDEGTDQFIHSPRFVLVDRRGDIRAYYEVVTEEEIDALPRAEVIDRPIEQQTKRRILRDVRSLLREPAR